VLFKYFFDIPIYRLPELRYNSLRTRYVEQHLLGPNQAFARDVQEMHQADPAVEIESRARLQRYYGGPWVFNEIVGYIRLHFLGSQIRGELWLAKRKRFVRTRRKQIEYASHKVASEIDVPFEASNEMVFDAILRYLEASRKELRGRHIDIAGFKDIGPYVDWKRLRRDA
jgi:hypothetical protein